MVLQKAWEIAVAMALIVAVVSAYPSGAPDSACASINPDWHGPSTATGPSPYILSLSSETYSPNQVITVKLSGALFKGYLIEGRLADGSTTNPVGFFQSPDPSAKLACTAFSSGNGVTQTNNTVKSSATFQWTAPSTSVGNIVFNFTVVRGGAPRTNITASDYYQGLKSNTIVPAGESLFFKKEETIDVKENIDSFSMIFEKIIRRKVQHRA